MHCGAGAVPAVVAEDTGFCVPCAVVRIAGLLPVDRGSGLGSLCCDARWRCSLCAAVQLLQCGCGVVAACSSVIGAAC